MSPLGESGDLEGLFGNVGGGTTEEVEVIRVRDVWDVQLCKLLGQWGGGRV